MLLAYDYKKWVSVILALILDIYLPFLIPLPITAVSDNRACMTLRVRQSKNVVHFRDENPPPIGGIPPFCIILM